MTQVDRRNIREPEDLVRLWTHETMRVYHDRLINEIDQEWFYEEMIGLVNTHFRIRWEKEEVFKNNVIHFTELLTCQEETITYEDIKDPKKILKGLEDLQEDYNQDNANKLTLCFFEDALEHMLRIVRILRQDRGNAILIGVPG